MLFLYTHEPLDNAGKAQRHACECIIVLLLYRAPLCHLQSQRKVKSKPPGASNAKRELESRHFVPSLFRERTAKEVQEQGNNRFYLGPIGICQVAMMSGGYSRSHFVGVFVEKRRILVERAAAASCSGKLCPMPWHRGHGLFCEVHPIQEWGTVSNVPFQTCIMFPI